MFVYHGLKWRTLPRPWALMNHWAPSWLMNTSRFFEELLPQLCWKCGVGCFQLWEWAEVARNIHDLRWRNTSIGPKKHHMGLVILKSRDEQDRLDACRHVRERYHAIHTNTFSGCWFQVCFYFQACLGWWSPMTIVIVMFFRDGRQGCRHSCCWRIKRNMFQGVATKTPVYWWAQFLFTSDPMKHPSKCKVQVPGFGKRI